MDQTKYISQSFEFSSLSDYQNFNVEIEKSLSMLDIKLRKKILICSSELIQNNIIHNNSSPSQLEIIQSSESIEITYSQIISQENATKLKSLILHINELELDKLKQQINENIINSKAEIGCGNGLMLCRLKSENKISFTLTNKISIKNSDYYFTKTTLQIKYYDKNS